MSDSDLNQRTQERDGAQSIDRAMAVLALVSSGNARGTTLAELVSRSNLKQPTVHRIVTALARSGVVEQDKDTKRYYLGYEAYVMGVLAEERLGLQRCAVDSVARLADVSEDTAFLTVRRGTHAVCTHREEGTYPIRAHVLSVGDRHPLGIGAGSIDILAALKDDEVEYVLDSNRAVYAERYPMVSEQKLRELVAEARARGFSSHRGLVHPGSWGIGVHINDRFGNPVAALSIGAAVNRLPEDRQEELAKLMHAEAERVEARLAGCADTDAAAKGAKPARRKAASRKQIA